MVCVISFTEIAIAAERQGLQSPAGRSRCGLDCIAIICGSMGTYRPTRTLKLPSHWLFLLVGGEGDPPPYVYVYPLYLSIYVYSKRLRSPVCRAVSPLMCGVSHVIPWVCAGVE